MTNKEKDYLLSAGQEEKSLSALSSSNLSANNGDSNATFLQNDSDCLANEDNRFQAKIACNNNNISHQEKGYENGFMQSDQHRRRFCPWRGMTMAVVLFLFGSLLIIAGIALISGVFHLKGLDSVTPYLILVFGALCVIPGAYHILVACCALRGHERFSFEDIPYFG